MVTAASSDIFSQISKAIEDVKAKKSILDKANEAASKAATDWQEAVDSAKSLRAQLNSELDVTVPMEIKPKIR